MFEELPFSRTRSPRRLGHTVVSASVHCALLVGAVLGARGHAGDGAGGEQSRVYPVMVWEEPAAAPAVEEAPPEEQAEESVTEPAPEVLPVAEPLPTVAPLPAPSIPVTIPGLPAPAPRPRQPVDAPVRIALPGAAPGGRPGRDSIYTRALVDEPAMLLVAPRPVYPAAFAGAGLEGRVVLEFVVDTVGRVEAGSVRVVESSHPSFEAAARTALVEARFRPALARGQAVRQRVRQAVKFVANPE
jgi:protein TonB